MGKFKSFETPTGEIGRVLRLHQRFNEIAHYSQNNLFQEWYGTLKQIECELSDQSIKYKKEYENIEKAAKLAQAYTDLKTLRRDFNTRIIKNSLENYHKELNTLFHKCGLGTKKIPSTMSLIMGTADKEEDEDAEA